MLNNRSINAPKLGMEVVYQDDGIVTVTVDNVQVLRVYQLPPAFPITFIDERADSRNAWVRPEWIAYPSKWRVLRWLNRLLTQRSKL